MPTSPNARHRLFLVDAMAHIYRAYYAVRGLATKSGQPTNAVFGFTSIVRKLQKTYAPEYLVVAMDSAAPSFRKAWFEDYKANRAEMPADLQEQIPVIEKVCDALRIPRVKVDGYEADDLIGTLARLAVEQGLEAVIVSNDKDMTQLVRDGVSILRVDNKSGEFVFATGPASRPGLVFRRSRWWMCWRSGGTAPTTSPARPALVKKGRYRSSASLAHWMKLWRVMRRCRARRTGKPCAITRRPLRWRNGW